MTTTYRPRRALTVNHQQVTVAVSPEVQYALDVWSQQYTDELATVLAPFGLHPYDLAPPQFRRVVTVDEQNETA